MKFSEMPYERPDMSALKEQFAALTERLQNAPDYAAARAAFLEEQVLNKHVDTLFTLASVRHTIDTRDKFYDEEIGICQQPPCRRSSSGRIPGPPPCWQAPTAKTLPKNTAT